MAAGATMCALLAAVGGAGPVAADATLMVAVVEAGSEATGDGGSDDCDAPLTDSATCSASSSGSVDGASGSSSSTAEGVLGFDDLGFLTSISASGHAGGTAHATATRAAYGEASSVVWAHVDVDRKVTVTIQGSLGVQSNGSTACSLVRIHRGEGSTVFDVRAPGSDCGQGGTFASSVDERVELTAGTYQLELRAYGGGRVLPGDGSASSQASFDLDVELLSCDNEYTDGPDTITGTSGDDVLCGGGGDDMIFGKGGDDTIRGGDGDDTILGGDGNDTIDGGPGDDGGRDLLFDGGPGNDELHGGTGEDLMTGGPGKDELHGGVGRDYLDGDTGADQLAGDGGNDVLQGGDGDDTLDGGPGNDLLLDHGSGDDLLIGRDGDDTLEAGQGDDILSGNAGADKLRGEAGEDSLTGGGGHDVLNGGAGPDILRARDTVSDSVLGGPGRDQATVDRRDTLTGVEVVRR